MNDHDIAVLKVQLDTIKETITDIKNEINAINKHNSRVIIAVILASQMLFGGNVKGVVDVLAREPAFINTTVPEQISNTSLK